MLISPASRGGNAFGPAVGLAGAAGSRLRLALLEIGAQLFGEPRLALVLRLRAGLVVPHRPLPCLAGAMARTI